MFDIPFLTLIYRMMEFSFFISIVRKIPRACLKNAFCKMCVTIYGKFRLNEGGVAGYVN